MDGVICVARHLDALQDAVARALGEVPLRAAEEQHHGQPLLRIPRPRNKFFVRPLFCGDAPARYPRVNQTNLLQPKRQVKGETPQKHKQV